MTLIMEKKKTLMLSHQTSPGKEGQKVTTDASLCCSKWKIITKDGDQVQIS